MVRTILFWCHLVVGVAAGLVVLVLAVTGVLLTYEAQITRLADRDLRVSPPSADAAPLAPEELLVRVTAHLGKPPTSLVVSADPGAPAEARIGRKEAVYVDPWTGDVLGGGSDGVRALFGVVESTHRWLALSGEARDAGRAVTGAANAAMFFLLLSGAYLWLPRRWTRRAVASHVLFDRRLRGKGRDWNWHHVFGFWALAPLFVVVLTGLVISYPWARAGVYALAGAEVPAQGGGGAPRGAEGGGPPLAERIAGLDAAWGAAAAHREPGWRTFAVAVPAAADAEFVFTVDHGNGRQHHRRVDVTYDRAGAHVTTTRFGDLPRDQQLRTLVRFGHTGEVAGVIGQTIAGLASLACAMLVWTGLALTYRRFFGRAARAATQGGAGGTGNAGGPGGAAGRPDGAARRAG